MTGNMDEIRAEPNLTPMLDVVFQLITFFMLCINFSQDNYDARVRLPVAGSAAPAEGAAQAAEDRLVLNIDAEGHLLFNGAVKSTEEALAEIGVQAQLVRLNAKVAGVDLKPEEGLPTTVVLRADRDTPFHPLYQIVDACQRNDFRKFALKAMNKP